MMRILKWLVAMLGFLTLAACGGGGGNAGTTPFGTGAGTGTGTGTGTGSGGTAGTTSVVLSISKTTIAVGSPATLTATVTTAAGQPASGQVVNFSTVSGLGAPSAPSGLTDASGTATVQLSPASSAANGADLAVATLATAAGTGAATGGSPSVTIGFQVTPTSSPPAGSPTVAVTLSGTAVSSTAPATLLATLRDAGGAPVAGQIVRFRTVDGLGTFNVPSALSDANGQVTARISPSSTSVNGADLAVVTATVNGTLVTGSAAFSVTSVGAPVVGVPALALRLSTTSVTTSSPATVTATVKDATGAGVAGQVVKFSTVDGLGTFDSTSALTDATGTANVTLSATSAGASGADQVLASTTVNGSALQASQGFQLTAPNAAIAAFSSDVGTATALSAYGQANLTVRLTSGVQGLPVSVSLSSACVAKGKATLTPASATTTTGVATFTYRDQGCGATDAVDRLQAAIAGNASSEQLALTLTSPAVASVNFVSATPSTIYLKGSGYTETSTVTFRVLDTAGSGLPNQSVLLEPSTLAGGLTLDGRSSLEPKLSDSSGNVSVIINSGTVPTPVRVKATLTNRGISTVSSNLSIAVGLPSQLNFSLSQQSRNIEGYDIDGAPNVYTIIASDRLANPVPAETAINFIAEGGQIEPSKFISISNGLAQAQANFRSSEPRPLDGRLTIVAYAIGEESFLDTNGNNVYNEINNTEEYFQDLGNVYLDRLFDGKYDNATDQFVTLSLPGVSASQSCVMPPISTVQADILARDPQFIPSVPSTCDGVWGRAYVRRAIETVLSTSVARPLWFAAPPWLVSDSTGTCAATKANLIVGYDGSGTEQRKDYYALDGRTRLEGVSKSGAISFIVADRNPVRFNPVAAGSLVTATATTGLTVTVAGGSPVPSTASPTFATINYSFDANTTEGTVTLGITSPSGVTTIVPLTLSTTSTAGAVACPALP